VPNHPDIIIAGHICLDVIPAISQGQEAFERLFRPGRLLEVGAVTFSTGGPVANTGLALHRLGVDSQLMGKTGDDLFGQAIRRLAASQAPALADSMLLDPAANTSYTIVINPPQMDRIFLHHPGANDTFMADDVRYERVAQSRAFHFGYPPLMQSMYCDSGRELVEIFRRAKAAGATTSLDMALPDPTTASGQADWAAILKATLPHVDIFLPSAEELLYMLRRSTLHDLQRQASDGDILPLVTAPLLSSLAAEVLALGSKIVAIKLGRRGFYLCTGDRAAIGALGRACPSDVTSWADRELWAPAFRANEVGATGSGDASIAGFWAALLRNLSPEETVIAATAVGACNVEAADALSGILTWPATQARVQAGWPKHELVVDAPGWRYDSAVGLWIGGGQ
jgi:sugar/nucleoside kinase (ribokinase family)